MAQDAGCEISALLVPPCGQYWPFFYILQKLEVDSTRKVGLANVCPLIKSCLPGSPRSVIREDEVYWPGAIKVIHPENMDYFDPTRRVKLSHKRWFYRQRFVRFRSYPLSLPNSLTHWVIYISLKNSIIYVGNHSAILSPICGYVIWIQEIVVKWPFAWICWYDWVAWHSRKHLCLLINFVCLPFHLSGAAEQKKSTSSMPSGGGGDMSTLRWHT